MEVEVMKQLPAGHESLPAECLQATVVASDAEMVAAGERMREMAMLEKEITAVFKPICEGAQSAHKAAVAQRDKFLQPTQQAQKHLRGLVAEYLGRRQQEQIQLTGAGMEPGPPPPLDAAGLSTVATEVVEVVDAALVPREWCVPDLKRIKAAAKEQGELLAIPGVQVRRETAVRRKAVRS